MKAAAISVPVRSKNRTQVAARTVFLFGGLGLWGLLLFAPNTWYDESFTAAAVTQPWEGLWRTACADFHPPLYYVLLKSFCTVFGDSLPVLRAFSLLPVLLLGLWGIPAAARAFGKPASDRLAILLLCCPVLPFFVVEIRMYTWALLFVSLAAFYAWQWHQTGAARDGGKFVLFAILGAYTHYYALLAVCAMNALLLWNALRQKRLLRVLPAAAVQLLSYAPWGYFLVSRVKTVAHGYWIAQSPVLYLVLLLAMGGSVLLAYLVRKDEKFAAASRAAAGVLVLALGAALLFSAFVRPIFVPRYLLPFLGLFLFQLCALWQGLPQKGRRALFLIWCIGFAVCQGLILFRFYAPQNQLLQAECARLTPQDTVVVSDCAAAGPLAVQAGAAPLYWVDNQDPLNPLAFSERARFLTNVNSLPALPGGRLLVVDTPNSALRETLLQKGYRDCTAPRTARLPYTFWETFTYTWMER